MTVANYQENMLSAGELKRLCIEQRVDHATRTRAFGLHKTNPKAAQEYVLGYARRVKTEMRKQRRW